MMNLHVFISALIGGISIGIASAFMMLSTGRIAGISGIAFNGVSEPQTQHWSLMFLFGLVLGSALFHFMSGVPVPGLDLSIPLLVTGGVLVGFGTKLGSGCTSGHGICGLARFSKRSLVAVVVFMTTAMLTVFVRLHGALA